MCVCLKLGIAGRCKLSDGKCAVCFMFETKAKNSISEFCYKSKCASLLCMLNMSGSIWAYCEISKHMCTNKRKFRCGVGCKTVQPKTNHAGKCKNCDWLHRCVRIYSQLQDQWLDRKINVCGWDIGYYGQMQIQIWDMLVQIRECFCALCVCRG